MIVFLRIFFSVVLASMLWVTSWASLECAVWKMPVALKSPRFLYLGLDNAKPDDYEAAARLSFGLWDSLPDRDLIKLAAKGELHTREQVSQQARKMLADPRARAKTLYFLQQWVQMNRVEDLSKSRR